MRRFSSTLALALALCPAAAHADPLPPEPDNGFVTDVHKTKAGTIVFARSMQAVTTPEKPAEFIETFKPEDSIFFRAYLPSSLNNAFRAQGVSCVGGERLWSISVDGTAIKEEGSAYPHFYGEILDQNGFSKSTSVRFDKALNAKPDGDKSIWSAFNDKVAPRLTPGEHTVVLAMRGLCKNMTTHLNVVYLEKDLAVGSFKLNVTKANLVEVLPKPSRQDPKLAKEASISLGRAWAGDQVLKVVFVERDWTKRYEVQFGRQVLMRRTIGAAVAVKQEKGCRVFNVTFEQKANGPSFGPTDLGSTGESRTVDCAAIK